MATSKMRWSAKDEKDFAKLRKNYNAKISRLKQTLNPEMQKLLPEPMKKSNIYSRADYTRMQRMGSMFTPRGSEKTVKFHGQDVPLFFKKQTQYIQKVENARRAHRRKQMTPERGTTSLKKQAAFMPMKLKGERSLVDLMKNKERLDRMLTDKDRLDKAELYKANYIRALRDQLGELAGPIIDIIEGLSAEEVVKALEEDYEFSIGFIYEYIEALTKGGALFARWFRKAADINGYEMDQEMLDYMMATYESGVEDSFNESELLDITIKSHPETLKQQGKELPDRDRYEILKAKHARQRRNKK